MEEQSAHLTVLNNEGQALRTRPFAEGILEGEVNIGLLHQLVRWQRSSWRSGTHSVQTRAEMTGGGKKPWKQKGTGNARSGSNTSAIWVGGGVAHGPKPRSYEFELNRKQRRIALLQALRSRYYAGAIKVIDQIAIETKTKSAAALLERLGIAKGETLLIVLDEDSKQFERCFRNIEGVKIISPNELNVYDLLHRKHILFTDKAVEGVEARFSR